jgi:hypothetical protein
VIINYPYKTQEVRDLAWACFSPPLVHIEQLVEKTSGIRACTPPLTARRQQWLERLDSDPGALLAHLTQRPTHRLGVYFERLWHFFLQHDTETELLAHNLGVHHAGRTLGEFDCIYYCHQRGSHIHLELAVKFFLGVSRDGAAANAGDARHWVGPDTRDRLDLKLDQLLQRQILLGENPDAQRTLAELGIGRLAREVVLKGRLFQPRTISIPPPAGYNRDSMPGRWIHCEDVRSYCATLGAQAYLILPKMRWLCAARCNDTKEALTLEQLLDRVQLHFAADSFPLLVAAMQDATVEAWRFFVTPAGWPDHPEAA